MDVVTTRPTLNYKGLNTERGKYNKVGENETPASEVWIKIRPQLIFKLIHLLIALFFSISVKYLSSITVKQITSF